MKRFLKYALLSIVVTILAVSVGLVIYYNTLYTKTTVPEIVQADTTRFIPFSNARPILFPVPKSVSWQNGSFRLPGKPNRFPPPGGANHLSAGIEFLQNAGYPDQAYRLSVSTGGVRIEYGNPEGAFHALTTLRQLADQTGNLLPCVEINDSPDLKTRGVLLDISRGKVPKLETLYEVVDLLADLKYNQLQLYIEGFSFGYPTYKRYWEKSETPLLPAEIQALDRYCADRFIELVPNQNSLGHMQDWLKQEDLKDLAECPEGYKLLGLIEMKTTLSPTDPRSLALVKQMSNDLLPNFTSQKFNVNLDEPFELGKSKQRPVSDPKEIANLYLDYALQLNDFVKSKGKKMMMWGDVISRTPEVINRIPKDITLLEWRYEAFQDFDSICSQYQKAGLHYMVCPGTSSWSSFTGRTNNMITNVSKAVRSAVRYGADGMLITDWGDSPHLQYLTVSYAGFAQGGALSWNSQSADSLPLGAYLSQVVFKDKSGTMGDLVLAMGRYNQFEEHPMMAMTTTNMALRFGIMDKVILSAINSRLQKGVLEMGAFDSTTATAISNLFKNPKPYNSPALLSYIQMLDQKLEGISGNQENWPLIKAEYKNALRMVKIGALLKHYNNYHYEQPDDQNRELLQEMKVLLAEILPEHQRLWTARNKRSSYDGSIESLSKLQSDVQSALTVLESNGFNRWVRRSGEKMLGAAAALYLR